MFPRINNIESTILSGTIITNDTTFSKPKEIYYFIIYDNYNFQNNLIIFSIYFLKFEDVSFTKF
jgi:hypothetical protein